MNQLKIFENKEFGQVRMVEVEGEPYFVGKDVADILGYQNGSRDINRHVDEEDRLTERIVLSGQNREVIIINESGLYSLILSSKLPKAKDFKRWVTSEVLPSIRKHGMYATDAVIDQILDNPDFGIQLLSQLKAEREEKERLQHENLQQKQMIGELQPKADYTDSILQSKDLVTISQIAKDYGMSGKCFNQILHKLQVQYKQNGQWLLYAKHQAKGYTHSETIHFQHKNGKGDTKMITKWTQKGRLFLYELLKKNNILPMIEQDSVA